MSPRPPQTPGAAAIERRGARAASAGALLAACLLVVACGGQTPTSPTPLPPVVAATADPLFDGGFGEVFVGAGDIGTCSELDDSGTSRLLDRVDGLVFALGDNAYPNGTVEQYRECYDPAWGRHRGRTRPVPGNHEYDAAGARPYFDYFGASAGPDGLGFYSFNLGAWHIVALNSNIGVSGTSSQAAWLRSDLAAHTARCTLAYWHHPLFSSGGYGDSTHVRDLWQILHAAGADVVLNGHEHFYERFAPQDPFGSPDYARGMRQFIVGTGGAPLRDRVTVHANSELLLAQHGVLKLTLRGGGYDWEFLSLSGGGDTGSGRCH